MSGRKQVIEGRRGGVSSLGWPQVVAAFSTCTNDRQVSLTQECSMLEFEVLWRVLDYLIATYFK